MIPYLKGALDGNAKDINSLKEFITGKHATLNQIELIKEILSYKSLERNSFALKLKLFLSKQTQIVTDSSIASANPSAVFERACVHRRGTIDGIGPDYSQAIVLYDRILKLGRRGNPFFISTIFELGYMYFLGYGEYHGTPNYQQAIKLYHQAIALNSSEAMDELAKIYASGHGDKSGRPDYTKAISLLNRSHSPLAEMLVIEYQRAIEFCNESTNLPKGTSRFFYPKNPDDWKQSSVVTKRCLGKLD